MARTVELQAQAQPGASVFAQLLKANGRRRALVLNNAGTGATIICRNNQLDSLSLPAGAFAYLNDIVGNVAFTYEEYGDLVTGEVWAFGLGAAATAAATSIVETEPSQQ